MAEIAEEQPNRCPHHVAHRQPTVSRDTSRGQCIHVRVRPLRTPPRPSNRCRRICRCFRCGGLCRTASPRNASAPWLDQSCSGRSREFLQPLVEALPVERQRLEAGPARLLIEPAPREQQPHRVNAVVDADVWDHLEGDPVVLRRLEPALARPQLANADVMGPPSAPRRRRACSSRGPRSAGCPRRCSRSSR